MPDGAKKVVGSKALKKVRQEKKARRKLKEKGLIMPDDFCLDCLGEIIIPDDAKIPAHCVKCKKVHEKELFDAFYGKKEKPVSRKRADKPSKGVAYGVEARV